MEWNEVAKALFYAGGSIIGIWVARSIEKMQQSVEKLNINVAVVVAQVETHEKRIEKLEERK